MKTMKGMKTTVNLSSSVKTTITLLATLLFLGVPGVLPGLLPGVLPEAHASELGELRDEVQELKQRLDELESSRVSEAAAVDELREFRAQFGANLGAFGDINYNTDSRERRRKSFSIGSLGLYTTASYRERLNFLFEMVIVAHNGRTSVSLERLWAGYTFNDLLIVRAGRFHAPLGYWNKAYHHGRHLFVTVDRPFFLKFEDIGGVMPVHVVGLELTGSMSIGAGGAGNLRYWLDVGNGPGIRADDHAWIYPGTGMNGLTTRNLSDNNDGKQFAGRLAYEPGFLPGLSLGVFGTNFTVEGNARVLPVSPVTTVAVRFHQTIYGGDLYLKKGGLELIGEYFRFKNGTEEGDAYYGQLAYTLGKWTPFTRYERLRSRSNDPYLSVLVGGAPRAQCIGGLRYDIDYLRSSLTAQYRYDETIDNDTTDDYDVFEFQWAFHF